MGHGDPYGDLESMAAWVWCVWDNMGQECVRFKRTRGNEKQKKKGGGEVFSVLNVCEPHHHSFVTRMGSLVTKNRKTILSSCLTAAEWPVRAPRSSPVTTLGSS